MNNEAYRLDQGLLIREIESGLRYEQLEEHTMAAYVNHGAAHIDESGVTVLEVHPQLSRRSVLERDEVEAWKEEFDGLPVWEETATYRWEHAPGPWAEEVEDSDEVEVGSAL